MLVSEGASMDSFINLYLTPSTEEVNPATLGRDSLRDLVESSLPCFEQEQSLEADPIASPVTPPDQQPWQQHWNGLTVQYQRPVDVPTTSKKYHHHPQQPPQQKLPQPTLNGWSQPQNQMAQIQNLLKAQTPVSNPQPPAWLAATSPPCLVSDPAISEIGDEVLSHILGIPVKSSTPEERKNVVVVANPSRGLFRDGALTGQQPNNKTIDLPALSEVTADIPGVPVLDQLPLAVAEAEDSSGSSDSGFYNISPVSAKPFAVKTEAVKLADSSKPPKRARVKASKRSAHAHSGELDPSGEEKRRAMICDICSVATRDHHLNYGASSCLSCRAFFRRCVQTGNYLKMRCQKSGGNCEVNEKTRRDCRSCRYHGCLRAGMKVQVGVRCEWRDDLFFSGTMERLRGFWQRQAQFFMGNLEILGRSGNSYRFQLVTIESNS